MRQVGLSSVRSALRLPIALLFMASAMSAPAIAQEEGVPDYARSGLSIGLGWALGIENFGDDAGASGSAPGLDFRVGYRTGRWIAVEMDFQYYEGFDADALREDNDPFGAWALSGNFKGYPLSGRFQPYGIGGIGAVDFELDESKREFLGRLGGGLDFHLLHNVVLNLEAVYNWPLEIQDSSDGLEDLQFISLVAGGQYRF